MSELDDFKKQFLENLKDSKEDDIKEAEIIESTTDIIEGNEQVTHEELIDSLLKTKNRTNEVLDHLIDLLYNEHPDNKTITETSRIIQNIVQIDKTIYDIALKTKDETTKDIMVKNSSNYLKELINNSKKENLEE